MISAHGQQLLKGLILLWAYGCASEKITISQKNKMAMEEFPERFEPDRNETSLVKQIEVESPPRLLLYCPCE